MDQLIEVTRHLSSEGVHHEDSTMQLFVWEVVVWLTNVPHKWRQLMMQKIVSKLHSPHVLEITPAKQKTKKTL